MNERDDQQVSMSYEHALSENNVLLHILLNDE